jgi:DNA (cytosine-5)-methyltransferase 1
MTHASLFSGIGGFDLAAEWMGWNNLFHCEWNPFGQKVLKHHFPNSISYNDITKTDFTIHEGSVDILTGGFPCQPYSTAGKRLGKQDERHLFPEMLRCIKEVKPRWVVGENVRGLVSWNEGLVFHEVYDDLEREGYEVQSFLIPAAGVNAPHQRYRIWFVAFNSKSQRNTKIREFCKRQNSKPFGVCRNNEQKDITNTNDKGGSTRLGEIQNENGEVSKWDNNAKFSDSNSSNDVTNSYNEKRLWENNDNRKWKNKEQESYDRNKLWDNIGSIGESKNVTNTSSNGRGKNYRLRESRLFNEKSKTNHWQNFPTQSPVCGGDDGLPRELDGITFSKWRQESIKAYGNAIVPQVAHQIFKTIEEFEKLV